MKKLVLTSIVVGGGATLWWYLSSSTHYPSCAVQVNYSGTVPTRSEQWRSLSARGTISDPFDILIIGGGATGAGCVIDAATRFAGVRISAVLRICV